MSATLSDGTTTITPLDVVGITESRPSGNRRHSLLGGGVVVSLVSAGLRNGVMELLFDSEADAAAAVEFHRAAAVFSYTDPDRLTMAMSYVLADGGDLVRTLDEETRFVWIVSVPYQEVQA